MPTIVCARAYYGEIVPASIRNNVSVNLKWLLKVIQLHLSLSHEVDMIAVERIYYPRDHVDSRATDTNPQVIKRGLYVTVKGTVFCGTNREQESLLCDRVAPIMVTERREDLPEFKYVFEFSFRRPPVLFYFIDEKDQAQILSKLGISLEVFNQSLCYYGISGWILPRTSTSGVRILLDRDVPFNYSKEYREYLEAKLVAL